MASLLKVIFPITSSWLQEKKKKGLSDRSNWKYYQSCLIFLEFNEVNLKTESRWSWGEPLITQYGRPSAWWCLFIQSFEFTFKLNMRFLQKYIESWANLSKHLWLKWLNIICQGPSDLWLNIKSFQMTVSPNGVLVHDMKGEWVEPHWEVQRVLFAPKRIEVLPHCGGPGERRLIRDTWTSATTETSRLMVVSQKSSLDSHQGITRRKRHVCCTKRCYLFWLVSIFCISVKYCYCTVRTVLLDFDLKIIQIKQPTYGDTCNVVIRHCFMFRHHVVQTLEIGALHKVKATTTNFQFLLILAPPLDKSGSYTSAYC